MKIYFIEKFSHEIEKYPKALRIRLANYLDILEKENKLSIKYFKKIKNFDLYEFRIRVDKSIYRVLTSKLNKELVVLTIFQKKTQKIPYKELKKAINRLNNL